MPVSTDRPSVGSLTRVHALTRRRRALLVLSALLSTALIVAAIQSVAPVIFLALLAGTLVAVRESLVLHDERLAAQRLAARQRASVRRNRQ